MLWHYSGMGSQINFKRENIMRKSYLEAYNDTLPETQQKRLLEIIQKYHDDVGSIPAEASYQEELERLVAELDKPLGSPLVKYRKVEKQSKTSSLDYNATMGEVYVDLGALYKYNNNINKTINIHRNINQTTLIDIRSALRNLENDVSAYRVIRENKSGINDAKYNTFFIDDNQSRVIIFKAWVDTSTNTVKLPVSDNNSLLNLDGFPVAQIDIQHYGGGIRGTIEDEKHRKEKAIDESRTTFWGEVILTDEPIRQTYNGVVEFGSICEITVTLLRKEMVNHISYDPFTNYPLEVLYLKYREHANDNWVNIPIQSSESVNSMEFNFNEVYAKQIMVVVNQKNPSINHYKIPRSIVRNSELWQQIVDREYSVSTASSTPVQSTQDMIDSITGWQAYVDAGERYKDKLKTIGSETADEDVSNIIFTATTNEITNSTNIDATSLEYSTNSTKSNVDDELVAIRKYEYVYGAYNIGIKRLWYMESGEYISPRYRSKGAIIESSLDVTEVVPSGSNIEYQVSTRDGSWRNILPSGSMLWGERLDIDPNTQTGYLRFPTDTTPSGIYRNGQDMPAGTYTYSSSDYSYVLASGFYSPSAVYTVAYLPKGISDVVPSGTLVSFANDTRNDAEETFKSIKSRQYKVTLEHFPWINYSIINDTSKTGESDPNFLYSLGRWQNQSDYNMYGVLVGEYYDPLEVTVDGYTAENRTDYYNKNNPALTSYNPITYPHFEFFQVGNNVYFNSSLEDKVIVIKYKYLNDFVQFKALLRNNDRAKLTSTPELHDFTLKLRTL